MNLSKEKAESGICPNCGSSIIDLDRDALRNGQTVYHCYDCYSIWFENKRCAQVGMEDG